MSEVIPPVASNTKAQSPTIAGDQVKLDAFSPTAREEAIQKMDTLVAQLEPQRYDLSSIVAYFDVDMFTASVHMKHDKRVPHMGPMVVSNGKGEVMCPNYVARSYGVKAQLFNTEALVLCPRLFISQYNERQYRYKDEMAEVLKVLVVYDPDIYRFEPHIDDAYLDLTNYVLNKYYAAGKMVPNEPVDPTRLVLPEAVWTLANAIVAEIRAQVTRYTKLTCSAGIAPTRMLAKICANRSKLNSGPNTQMMLKATSMDIMTTFLDMTYVREVDGVRENSAGRLNAFGIRTCSDIYEHRDILELLFKHLHDMYIRASFGICSIFSVKQKERQESFIPTNIRTVLSAKLEQFGNAICEELVAENIVAVVVRVEITWSSYLKTSKADKLDSPTNQVNHINGLASGLMDQILKHKAKQDGNWTIRKLLLHVGYVKQPKEKKVNEDNKKSSDKVMIRLT